MYLHNIFSIVLVVFLFINQSYSLECYGGLNEFFSDDSLILENTHYTCGNNSDWDEILQEDGEWFCMKGVQSQSEQTILEYGCALGCVPTESTYNDVTKKLYCCSTDLCNHSSTMLTKSFFYVWYLITVCVFF